MLKTYPDDVKLVYKSFPLPNHKFANEAAKAAFAAGKQGKFWEMHNALLDHFQALSEEKILALAKELELDMALFEKDRNDEAISRHILADIKNGREAGVDGTPTIFVNGRQLKSVSMTDFQRAIAKEMQTKEQS